MKRFNIHSWKSSIKYAFIIALFEALFCISYTYFIMFLAGGENFVGKGPAITEINGIKHNVVLAMCGILSFFIPLIMVKYKSFKHSLLYILLSVLVYFILMMLCVVFVIDDNFDLLSYALLVPIGLLCGNFVLIIVEKVRRKN